MIELTDEEYALLLKIASGMRDYCMWDHGAPQHETGVLLSMHLHPFWKYDQRSDESKGLTPEGVAAMREYERKHNVSIKSE